MKITERMREEVIALHTEGNTRENIAEKVGISQPSVRKILRGAGFTDLRKGDYGK